MQEMNFLSSHLTNLTAPSEKSSRVTVQGEIFWTPHPQVHGQIDSERKLAVLQPNMEYYANEYLDEIMKATGTAGVAIMLTEGVVGYVSYPANMCRIINRVGLPFHTEEAKLCPFGEDVMFAHTTPYQQNYQGALTPIVNSTGFREDARMGVLSIRVSAGCYRLLATKDLAYIMQGNLLIEEAKVERYKLAYSY